jgi:site-specific recombinase XerD
MKLMEQVCQLLRVKHYSLATERCYCQWIRRFIFFHGVKHPNHLLEMGQDIRTVQERLGHNDVSTTMIYTHVMEKAASRVRSPLDA